MAQRFQQTVGRFTTGEVVAVEPAAAVTPRKAKGAVKRETKTPAEALS